MINMSEKKKRNIRFRNIIIVVCFRRIGRHAERNVLRVNDRGESQYKMVFGTHTFRHGVLPRTEPLAGGRS